MTFCKLACCVHLASLNNHNQTHSLYLLFPALHSSTSVSHYQFTLVCLLVPLICKFFQIHVSDSALSLTTFLSLLMANQVSIFDQAPVNVCDNQSHSHLQSSHHEFPSCRFRTFYGSLLLIPLLSISSAMRDYRLADFLLC